MPHAGSRRVRQARPLLTGLLRFLLYRRWETGSWPATCATGHWSGFGLTEKSSLTDLRERCVSGRPGKERHEQDRARSRVVLIRQNSTTQQRRAPTDKDSIPLLKRVSQVRILPGAPAKRPRTDHGPGPLTAGFYGSDASHLHDRGGSSDTESVVRGVSTRARTCASRCTRAFPDLLTYLRQPSRSLHTNHIGTRVMNRKALVRVQ